MKIAYSLLFPIAASILCGFTCLADTDSPDSRHTCNGRVKHVLFLIDCSNSMQGKLKQNTNYQTKMLALQAKIHELVKVLPSEVSCSLRSFGQGVSGDDRSDCGKTDLLIPTSASRKTLLQQIDDLKPSNGPCNSGLALEDAIKKDLSSNHEFTLIVLATGGVDQCGADSAAFVVSAPHQSDFELLVFSLTEYRVARAKNKNLAEAASGHFYELSSFDSLLKYIKSLCERE